MKYYIINNASRAAVYGIGTYVRQVTEMLKKSSSLQIFFIDLYADEKEFSIVQDSDGFTHFKIPMASTRMEDERYCRMAYYLLSPYLSDSETAIFHFNYFQHYPLALLLKAKYIHHRILLSVHYLNWCFELNGNVSQFREIVGAKVVEDKYRSIVYDFSAAKHFLRLADEVIVLSRFCQHLLQSDYGISPKKLQLIYNGLQEIPFVKANEDGKNPIVLFVGRLDKIKGVDYLIKAFEQVLRQHNDARLVIVGDGDYNEYLKHCKGFWKRVTFTGKISQEELLSFYRQATVGVLPSFHEQCSYTAIEFMMHGIPFIGTDSTGLSEMLDCVPKSRVHIKEAAFSEDEFITNLTDAICYLLENESVRQETAQKMVAQYQERYTLQVMEERLLALINPTFLSKQVPLSQDFFEKLDDYMISLIHEKVDIDTSFYGMAGIGVYLWWRLGQSDLLKDEPKSYKIKEYLIYYLDWFYESIASEQEECCESEVAITLRSMLRAGFYKTKVASIMDLLHCETGKEPSEECFSLVILQNAMRMFTTKI